MIFHFTFKQFFLFNVFLGYAIRFSGQYMTPYLYSRHSIFIHNLHWTHLLFKGMLNRISKIFTYGIIWCMCTSLFSFLLIPKVHHLIQKLHRWKYRTFYMVHLKIPRGLFTNFSAIRRTKFAFLCPFKLPLMVIFLSTTLFNQSISECKEKCNTYVVADSDFSLLQNDFFWNGNEKSYRSRYFYFICLLKLFFRNILLERFFFVKTMNKAKNALDEEPVDNFLE